MNLILEIVLIVIALFILWQATIRIARKTVHFPAPAFIGPMLDSDYRRAMQPPAGIIERSGIRKGMRVLEVGCGSGAYTTYVARAVGPEGKVYALDIQPKMLEQLGAKLARPENEGIKNIEPLGASAYDMPLDDGSVDLAYMITVFQEIPDKQKTLAEIKRVLRPGGILAVTEFLPDPDYPLKSTTKKALERGGFTVESTAGSCWNYTVRAVKPLPDR